MFGPSGKVYAPYVLARTLEVLRRAREIALPGDIRALLEAVYAEREEHGGDMAGLLNAWQAEKEKLSRLALQAGAELGQSLDDTDDRLRTRYSERESVGVLLVQGIEETRDGLRITAADGLILHLPAHAGDARTRRRAAAALARYTLKADAYLAPQGTLSEHTYDCLRKYIFIGGRHKEALVRKAPLVRVGLLEPSGRIREIDGSYNRHYTIDYASHLGYTAEKRR